MHPVRGFRGRLGALVLLGLILASALVYQFGLERTGARYVRALLGFGQFQGKAFNIG